MDFITALSLLASIASLVLAIVAIGMGKSSERESMKNFEKTQKIMTEYYEKTKDVLSEIDKRAAITENTVATSQEKMLNTLTTVVSETVIPKKQDLGEQFGLMLMQMLMQNPKDAANLMNSMKPLIDLGNQAKKDQGLKSGT